MKIQTKSTLKITGVLLGVFLYLLPFASQAQSTLNASGGSYEMNEGTFYYSIGEMTLVNTLSNSRITVTQGLLQVESDYLDVNDEIFTEENMKVFPNPAKEDLYIQPSLTSSGQLTVALFDLNGRRVLEESFYLQSGNEQQKINVSHLSDATYMLNVQFHHQDKQYRQSYKIIKFSN